MVYRGEVGKALFHYVRNSVASDPLGRTGNPQRYRDEGNYFTAVLGRAATGRTNPERTRVDDPGAMSRHIKNVGRYFGADIVGIGRAHPALLYHPGTQSDGRHAAEDLSGGASPAELCRKYPYVIVAPVAWDYRLGQAHRHQIGDAAYNGTSMQTWLVLAAL